MAMLYLSEEQSPDAHRGLALSLHSPAPQHPPAQPAVNREGLFTGVIQ